MDPLMIPAQKVALRLSTTSLPANLSLLKQPKAVSVAGIGDSVS
jgi:hypothetical protein